MDNDSPDERPVTVSPTRKPIYMFANKHRTSVHGNCIGDKENAGQDRPLSPMCLKIRKVEKPSAQSDLRSSPSSSPRSVSDQIASDSNTDVCSSKENRSADKHDRSMLSPPVGSHPSLRAVHPLDMAQMHRIPVTWPYPAHHHSVFPPHPRPMPMSLQGPIQPPRPGQNANNDTDRVHSPEGARTGNAHGGGGEPTSPGRFTRFFVTDILNANTPKSKSGSDQATAQDTRIAYHGAFRRLFPGFALHLPNRPELGHPHGRGSDRNSPLSGGEHRKNDHIDVELGKLKIPCVFKDLICAVLVRDSIFH
jgi:hypothetical protein